MTKNKIYLAGAMSNFAEQGMAWRNELHEFVKQHSINLDLIDPFQEEHKSVGKCFEDSYAHVRKLIEDNNITALKEYMERIYQGNLSCVKSSKAMLVMLDEGFKTSIGTHIELQQALNNNIPIFFLYKQKELVDNASVWVYFFQDKIYHWCDVGSVLRMLEVA